MIGTLLAWFLFSVVGGLTGLFANAKGPPVALGLSVLSPVVLFLLFYATLGSFRQQLQKIDLGLLVNLHVIRIIGLWFIIDFYRGMLPLGFAMPAGLGDIAIGITAPLIALLIRSQYAHKRDVFVVWNVLGIADLVLAVTTGILHSQSSFGLLASHPTTELMTVFPRNIIPTFLVPLFVIIHILALSRSAEVENPKYHQPAVSG
jgi:hypothetical protein